jgi:hypothetical protein
VIVVHQKIKNISPHPTPEAVKNPFLFVDGEGRGLLSMKRAKTNVVAAGLFEGDVIGHHLHDGRTRPNL